MLKVLYLLICMSLVALSRSGCPCKNEIRNYNICMKSSNSCGLHLSEFEACTKDRFNSLEIKINALNNKIRNIPGSTHVSFMAIPSINLKMRPGNILKFQTVTINRGNGYDNRTGVFTAPVEGTYSFTLAIGMPTPSRATDYLRLHLFHNSKLISIWWTGWGGLWRKRTDNALVDLKKGDRVFVKVHSWPSEYRYIGRLRQSNFNGFLIN